MKRSGPYGRAVAIATSRDFETWKDYGVVFHADAEDQEIGRRVIEARLTNPHLKQTEYNTPEHYSVQIYNMGVFLYEGIFVGLPSMYHHTGKVPKDWPGFDKMHLSPGILELVHTYGDYTGFYNVQLVCSRDLTNWERLGDRKPFIETSPLGAGAYDLQTMIGPSAPVERGDELWFYYTGIKAYAFISSGGEPGYDNYSPDRGAICLAVLRRDGFISLDADEKEGTVLTRPFVLAEGHLHLNVDAAKGHAVVQVCDERGEAISGYETSGAIEGDRFDAIVGWPDANLQKLAGQSICLRITLCQAELYAYWIE